MRCREHAGAHGGAAGGSGQAAAVAAAGSRPTTSLAMASHSSTSQPHPGLESAAASSCWRSIEIERGQLAQLPADVLRRRRRSEPVRQGRHVPQLGEQRPQPPHGPSAPARPGRSAGAATDRAARPDLGPGYGSSASHRSTRTRRTPGAPPASGRRPARPPGDPGHRAHVDPLVAASHLRTPGRSAPPRTPRRCRGSRPSGSGSGPRTRGGGGRPREEHRRQREHPRAGWPSGRPGRPSAARRAPSAPDGRIDGQHRRRRHQRDAGRAACPTQSAGDVAVGQGHVVAGGHHHHQVGRGPPRSVGSAGVPVGEVGDPHLDRHALPGSRGS